MPHSCSQSSSKGWLMPSNFTRCHLSFWSPSLQIMVSIEIWFLLPILEHVLPLNNTMNLENDNNYNVFAMIYPLIWVEKECKLKDMHASQHFTWTFSIFAKKKVYLLQLVPGIISTGKSKQILMGKLFNNFKANTIVKYYKATQLKMVECWLVFNSSTKNCD